LFRHLLLQIGGANIENPPTSSSLAEERTPPLAPPLQGGARSPTLAAVLERHLGYRQAWFAPLLGRLVIPDHDLAEVGHQLPAGTELSVTVINTGGAGGLVALARRSIPGLSIEAVSSALRDLDDLESNATRVVAAAAELPEGIETYVELPYAPGWQAAAAVVEAEGLLGKIRIGGGDRYPRASAEQLADQLSVLIEADLPFAAARVDRTWPLVNLLVAVDALIDGAEQQDAVELLLASDSDRIASTVSGWDTATHDRVRRRLRTIDCQRVPDLVDDLVAAGLITPPAR
jgi:hypothetical protein